MHYESIELNDAGNFEGAPFIRALIFISSDEEKFRFFPFIKSRRDRDQKIF